MSELTPAAITALLASQRNRGGHERFLKSFVSSGDMYLVVSDSPIYASKCEANFASVKNQLTTIAKKAELPIRFVKNDTQLVAVNMDVLEAHAEAA